jgi:hypothetical protein
MAIPFPSGGSTLVPGSWQAFWGRASSLRRIRCGSSRSRSRPSKTCTWNIDPDNFWWQRVYGLTRRAVERWGDQVAVGHTDLGGNLDILASFRGSQQLVLDLYDAPEEVDRLVGEITRLWLRYYDELYDVIQQSGRGTTPWAPIWSPGRTYMLQSDFAYMISPKMFERFVMPDLQACCAALDHAFYHLDGKGRSRISISCCRSITCGAFSGCRAMARRRPRTGCRCSSASATAASCARWG